MSIPKHFIELKTENTHLIRSASYQKRPEAPKFENTATDNILWRKISELSQTEWTAIIVFAPKMNGSLRFFVDYKKPNAVAERHSYPITRIEKYIASLEGMEVFSTLDANSGYLKVENEETNCDETALKSHHGQCCFVEIPSRFRTHQEPIIAR